MKLHKTITVAGTPYAIVDSNVRVNLFTPGRALFTVQAEQSLKGLVVFSCGYDVTAIKPWFLGFVEACTQVDKKQQRIFCRELSAALYYRLPLALRGVDLQGALNTISGATGLRFTLPAGDMAYLKQRVATLYNTANGYHMMDSLGEVFGIAKLLWQQQTDGQVFVGSWNDSNWATSPVQVDRTWERQLTSHNGATLPVMPTMRPGALYNGDILTGVELVGAKMNITWSANPWAER
ncbi:hypothetical protein MJO52_11760 [Microbulbifer variabilis]|uniref:Uncharacterized protein n=1 Tax=Microbulbifer variabilis TaxID=266805 RepID=A0ABY4V6A5_9GAMM|nr:hypothetical protein [Microbulbifer variabilis]USD19758.1 hypothetical protein MJO52_11760 [Microbulbifer variabilis]